MSREQRQDQLVDHADRPQEGILRWPWPDLDELLNGFWPGEITVLGGITRHGKSVLCDQIGEHIEKQGGSACLYLTEMQEKQRDLRFISRRTGIPFKRLLRGQLEGGEHSTYVKAVKQIPFEIVRVGTRTAIDVARDIRRRQWSYAVVDLLNGLPGREREQVEENFTILAAAAQESGTHILCCQHLNRNRQGMLPYPPEPVLSDIRSTGQIADLATQVLFVYRFPEQDQQGNVTHHPGPEAYVEVAKAKNGEEGRVNLRWNGQRMRYDLPVRPGTVGGLAA